MYAPGGAFGEMIWMTPAEFEDFNAYLGSRGVSVGKRGTDGELTLAEAAGSSAQGIQAAPPPSPSLRCAFHGTQTARENGKRGKPGQRKSLARPKPRFAARHGSRPGHR